MFVFKIFSVIVMLLLVIKGLLSFLPAILVFLAIFGAFVVYKEVTRNRNQ